MTSILERLDDLIRGSLHRFVDRALASNSLVLYDQDVRDMGTAIAHLEEAAASMYAAARANERRLVRHQEDVEQTEQILEHLEAKGEAASSERVTQVQAELEAGRGLVNETQAQIERQQAQYETLKRTLAETEVTAHTLKDARPRLESLLVMAEASRSIERVEMTLDALRGLGGDSEVALVADSIFQRFSEAQVRLDHIRQAESLELLIELEQAEVDDQLAQRRRRLGLATEPQLPVHPPATSEAVPPKPAEPEPSRPAGEPDAPESSPVNGVDEEQGEQPLEPDASGTPPEADA